MRKYTIVAILALVALLPMRSFAAAATVNVTNGQFEVLGNTMVGKLTFAFTADSSNILVTDEHGLSMPLIVRDPRDPVFPELPDDAFTIWRTTMANRLLADTTLSNERIAAMIADSLRSAKCINVSVTGAIVSYQQSNDPTSATSWIIQRRTVVPRTLQLQRFLDPILRQLQSGRTVYVLWSGRTLSCSARQVEALRTGAVFGQHSDLTDLKQRPVSPVTLRQEVRQ